MDIESEEEEPRNTSKPSDKNGPKSQNTNQKPNGKGIYEKVQNQSTLQNASLDALRTQKLDDWEDDDDDEEEEESRGKHGKIKASMKEVTLMNYNEHGYKSVSSNYFIYFFRPKERSTSITNRSFCLSSLRRTSMIRSTTKGN